MLLLFLLIWLFVVVGWGVNDAYVLLSLVVIFLMETSINNRDLNPLSFYVSFVVLVLTYTSKHFFLSLSLYMCVFVRPCVSIQHLYVV